MTLNPTTEHDALPAFTAEAPLQDSFFVQSLIALVAIVAVVAIMMVNGFLLGGAPRARPAPGNLPTAAPRTAMMAGPAASTGQADAAPPLPASHRRA